MMRTLWIRFGCFLCGYNYRMIRNSSEASIKAVLKYLSAILIVATLWGFIGYAFTQRYLHGEKLVCILAALLMIFIVIQIERQIILSVGKNRGAAAFRIVIGIVMAIIGSVILDQIMYKDDIARENRLNIQNEVNKEMPLATRQLNDRIGQLDTTIRLKEAERLAVINDVKKHPTIITPTSRSKYERDTATGKMVVTGYSVTNISVPNPEANRIQSIDEQVKSLRVQKDSLENKKLNLRDRIQADIESEVGFLNELTILFNILFSSGIALFVWTLLFIFFLAIELFVLSNKFLGDTQNDYDKTIMHQMTVRLKMLEQLVEPGDGKEIAGIR